MTHPQSRVDEVLALSRAGLNKTQVARMTGLPRATVRDWIDGPRYIPRETQRDRRGCVRCDDRVEISTADYAYLLGLYLGDGCLSAFPRGVWCLRIVQDARYPRLVALCRETMWAICETKIALTPAPGCIVIAGYWKHWIHLFPQHAPGRKHDRIISLESWQARIVDNCPEQFLRGLIHSDGCRCVNTVRSVTSRATHQYSYPRYMFSQKSDDIRRMFTDTCDQLGIHWTTANSRNIAISRKPDVAFLDTFIGPKS